MRVATANTFDRAIEGINDQRAQLQRTQEQLSSGTRITRISDDPLAAAGAERARSGLSRLDVEKRMVEYAQQMLGLAEGALSSGTEVLQSARENLLQASNATLNPTDRAAIAQQLQAQHDELLALANRTDGAGGFLFGGQGSVGQPFQQGTQVSYAGQTGAQVLPTDPAVPITLDGSDTFMNLPAPGGSGAQSIFKTLTDAIAVLRNPASTSQAVGTAMQSAVTGVDAALDRLSLKRAQVGEYGRAIDDRRNLIDSGKLDLSGWMSTQRDVDYAKAISDLSSMQTAVNASMQAYSKISKTSLLDYL